MTKNETIRDATFDQVHLGEGFETEDIAVTSGIPYELASLTDCQECAFVVLGT